MRCIIINYLITHFELRANQSAVFKALLICKEWILCRSAAEVRGDTLYCLCPTCINAADSPHQAPWPTAIGPAEAKPG